MTVAQGTPRTDAVLTTDDGARIVMHGRVLPALARLARELERENAALSAQVVELQQQIARDKVTHDLDLLGKMLEVAKAKIIKLSDQVVELQKDAGEKQAKIDRLMLEFCPDEMTKEQVEEWGKHQKPVHSTVTRASAPPKR